jgi:antirestriction protein
LAAYNSGKLHGDWVPATDEDELREGIEKILKTSPEPDAEEHFFADWEGFCGYNLGEYASVEETVKAAEILEEHGEAALKFADNCGEDITDDDFVDKFEAAYNGHWDSEEAFAENYLEECDASYNAIPDRLKSYFDVERYADGELFCGAYWSANADSGVYVFANL